MKNTLFYEENLEVPRGRDADGRGMIADERQAIPQDRGGFR